MTIAQFCAEAGIQKPARAKHASRICTECGSDEFIWGDEFMGNGASPESTGYVRLMCADCGEFVADDGTVETRYWMGH